MGVINVLDFSVANLIAAGEVVDRPASVIKELMENSIDSGARHITVEIQNGGVTFMRVSDDGCGMEAEDLPVAIRRHATSKIKNAADLESILTLGFRGEALAAISSVSDMRILSKRREAEMGAVMEAHAGEIVSLNETGCPDGTTVIVEALFANVPARRKFLKRDVTESQAVSAAVERVALSHPEIAFKLIIDGEIKLNTAGDGKLQSAIYAVFGRDFAGRLIALDGEYEGIRVGGFIGRSDNVKGTRNYQNFFINGRWIRSKTAMAALEQAFCSYLPPDKYPTCVMTLSLNPSRVDINVHPAKLEVKFSNEKLVFEAIYYAVRNALEQDMSRPEVKLPEIKSQKESARRVSDAFAPINDGPVREQSLKHRQIGMQTPTEPAAPAPSTRTGGFEHLTAEEYVRNYLHATPASAAPSAPAQRDIPSARVATPAAPTRVEMPAPAAPTPSEGRGEAAPATVQVSAPADVPVVKSADTPATVSAPAQEVRREVPPAVMPREVGALTEAAPSAAETATKAAEVSEAQAPSAKSWRIVGEVFHSYVIVQVEDRMLIIDKHAAHERILFEQLKQKLHSTEPSSQLLMIPVEVMMMSDEVAIMEEYRAELSAIGFEYTTARNTVSVSALPTGVEPDMVADMLCAIADRIKNDTGSAALTRDILFEKALYQSACKAAIKAGRIYADGQIEWLVGKLMALPNITACPHGRPVAMEMSKQNLDHQFERS